MTTVYTKSKPQFISEIAQTAINESNLTQYNNIKEEKRYEQ
jgi:hypothetical protein